MTFVPLSPIPLKDRTSMIFLQYGQIDVLDGAFVLIDKTGIRTHIPVGSVACIMLEPGTRVSHAAVHLAATVGTLLVWVGEAGVRVYSSGQPGGARADKLLYQAKLALTEDLRLKVVPKCMNYVFVSHRQLAVQWISYGELRDPAFARPMHYWRNNMV